MFTDTIPRLADISGGTIALLGSDGTFEFDDLVVTVLGPPPPTLEERVEALESQVTDLQEQIDDILEGLRNCPTTKNFFSEGES
jgi:hypothetical protein